MRKRQKKGKHRKIDNSNIQAFYCSLDAEIQRWNETHTRSIGTLEVHLKPPTEAPAMLVRQELTLSVHFGFRGVNLKTVTLLVVGYDEESSVFIARTNHPATPLAKRVTVDRLRSFIQDFVPPSYSS